MLTIAQLLQLASNAGFSGSDLITAVAIAMVESGGVVQNYNPEPGAKGGTPAGQGSYGLWQIYLKMHPEFSTAQLLDPQGNANAAYAIYSGDGESFRQWTGSYVNGKYLAYLPAVNAALGSSSSSPAPIDGSSTDQTATDQASILGGNGTTNYWPLLLVAGEILFVWLFARG